MTMRIMLTVNPWVLGYPFCCRPYHPSADASSGALLVPDSRCHHGPLGPEDPPESEAERLVSAHGSGSMTMLCLQDML